MNNSGVTWLYYSPGEEHIDICGFNEDSKFDNMVAILGNEYVTDSKFKYEHQYNDNDLSIEMQFEPYEDQKLRCIIIRKCNVVEEN